VFGEVYRRLAQVLRARGDAFCFWLEVAGAVSSFECSFPIADWLAAVGPAVAFAFPIKPVGIGFEILLPLAELLTLRRPVSVSVSVSGFAVYLLSFLTCLSTFLRDISSFLHSSANDGKDAISFANVRRVSGL
jgi:hypothetical protein